MRNCGGKVQHTRLAQNSQYKLQWLNRQAHSLGILYSGENTADEKTYKHSSINNVCQQLKMRNKPVVYVFSANVVPQNGVSTIPGPTVIFTGSQ